MVGETRVESPEKLQGGGTEMTGYTNKHLQPGESIEYRGQVTRLILLPALFMFVSAIVVLSILHSKSSTPSVDFLRAMAIIDLIGSTLRLIFGYVAVASSEYAATDRRIIGKHGLIRRDAMDILFTQISGVEVKQGFFGRIFGYGTLDVLAAGAHRKLNYIKRPLKFRAAIYAQLEDIRLLKGTAAYTLDVRSVPGEPAAAPPAFANGAATAPPPPPNTPAQWAADPSGNGCLRYWDGSSWTGHTAPGQPTLMARP
jgi:membrane protein YdbS with pleckstrin-like domain